MILQMGEVFSTKESEFVNYRHGKAYIFRIFTVYRDCKKHNPDGTDTDILSKQGAELILHRINGAK